MAFTGRVKDFKSGSNPLGAQAQPATASNAAVSASAAAARQVTTAPARHLFSEENKTPTRHSMMPFLDDKALACLIRVRMGAKALTQEELDQRGARKLINLAFRGEVSDLHLMRSPTNNTPYKVSDERHLYLYQEKDGRVFYYYEGGQGQQNPQQKHYLHDEKQQEQPSVVGFKPDLFTSSPDNLQYCTEEALRQSVFDITTKRKHTRCSDSEEIRRIVDANPRLPLVVYRPMIEKDKTARNKGGQLISLVGKTPLQVAHGEDHDYAMRAMTSKLLDVKDEKQKQANGQKIQAQYAAQDALGSAEEEQVKAKNRENVKKAQKALEKAVLESKPGDIQDAGHPTCKLTLAKTAGGAAIAAAVTQLEASLEVIRNTVVRTGCHDNPELQLQAREEYDRLLDADHDWQGAKMQFLFRNLGRYQQMMSLGYAHGFCGDGLYENVDKLKKGQTPRESTSVVVWDSVLGAWSGSVGVYSLRGPLGVDFAIAEVGWGWVVARRGAGFFCGFDFKSYVNQKQLAHRPITQQQRDHRSDPPKSSCVVM